MNRFEKENYINWLKKRICWLENADLISNGINSENGDKKGQDSLNKFKDIIYRIWVFSLLRWKKGEERESDLKNLVGKNINLSKDSGLYNLKNFKNFGEQLLYLNVMGISGDEEGSEKNISKEETKVFIPIIASIFRIFDNKCYNDSIKQAERIVSQVNVESFKISKQDELGFYITKIKKSIHESLTINKDLNLIKKFIEDSINTNNAKSNYPQIFKNLITAKATETGNSKKALITMARHSDVVETSEPILRGKYDKIGRYYHESLSGGSSHLNILSQMLNSDLLKNRLESQVIETGLIRILVADERVGKLVSKNIDVYDSLVNGGVDVIKNLNGLIVYDKNDGEHSLGIEKITNSNGLAIRHENDLTHYENEQKDFVDNAGDHLKSYKDLWKTEKGDLKNKYSYDMLIIHQGILDKTKLEREPIDWDRTLVEWKNKFQYVIITSGRGTPDKLSPYVKFIPFSIIENTLMDKYHGKFLLIRSLMKILGKKKKDIWEDNNDIDN